MTEHKPERNRQMYELYRDGMSQAAIGERFGISQQAVSEVVRRYRNSLPMQERAEFALDQIEQIRDVYGKMAEILNSDPLSKYDGAGEDRVEVRVDHSGRISAAREMRKLMERMSKLVGLDSPVKIEADTTVRYSVEGLDPDALK